VFSLEFEESDCIFKAFYIQFPGLWVTREYGCYGIPDKLVRAGALPLTPEVWSIPIVLFVIV
jgi:hypothetical protein